MSSDHSLAKGTFDRTKSFTCCVNGYSNQSRLNKNVAYPKITRKKTNHMREASIKAIFKPRFNMKSVFNLKHTTHKLSEKT